MAQPVWITPAGSLGTVPEGVFYSVPLVAEDPTNTDTIYYQLIAGSLPAGIQLNATGILTGIPKSQATIQGVPLDVIVDTTSKFAVRAYTTTIVSGVTVINRLADRTFSLTITGPGAPEFTTPAGSIASCFDGSEFTPFQVEYTESDLPRTTVSLRAGQLPLGLSISSTGLITGLVQPLTTTDATQGFSRDGQGYDQYPFDFATRSVDYTYEFVLEVNNGYQSNLRAFNITVYSRNDLVASTTYITADNIFITADGTPIRAPVITTPTGSIGSTRNDNFFAYQFTGVDFDGDQFEFIMVPDPSVPGLTLDSNSGWLYGYIPNLGLTELTYDFAIYARKKYSVDVISNAYNYSLTISGAIGSGITWITDSDLGTINVGAISTLSVEAITGLGIPLQYRLQSGSNSLLPQGLELLPTGEIAGRVSFNGFMLDGGTTTFDVNNNNTNKVPTTFDHKFTFIVEAYGGINDAIDVFKTFTITVNQLYNEPYDNLYVEVMPPANDRQLIQTLLQNNSIFPPEILYRPADPWFGKTNAVVYQHAYGLTSATYPDYVSSLYLNHYWKNLVLGQIKTAQALDDAGNVIYEVVYSEVIDNLINNSGVSVNKEVVLAYPINAGDSTEIDTVWPNSLVNMRNQVIDTVGQISNILPRWMLSKQTNGQVLGFTPAWVICYTKPGYSGQVQYNIQSQFSDQLNLVDFKVDRYELDRSLSKDWDPETISFNITNITGDGSEVTVTFDNGDSTVPFAIGQRLTITSVAPIIYNNTIFVTSCTDTQFTYSSKVTTAYISGGTVTTLPHWVPTPAETTFDVQAHYQLPVPNDSSFIFDGGIDYAIDDQILILGSDIGGVDGVNDVTITVEEIDTSGTILMARATGIAPLLSVGDIYTNIIGTNITGSGTGATWDLEVVGENPTVFDGNSLKFISPVDMYGPTQQYDKYLVFPKRTILG